MSVFFNGNNKGLCWLKRVRAGAPPLSPPHNKTRRRAHELM
jgi:hypothetical protein